MATSIQSLSLCSGVGMLDLGVTLACHYLGWAYRSVGFCERDAYAASVLLAREEAFERRFCRAFTKQALDNAIQKGNQ